MEQVYEFIQLNIIYAPYIIFGLLLLAGFNLPVSEDILLYISGLMAINFPNHAPDLFLGVFLGAYCSDLICYWFCGRYLGDKIFSLKTFNTKKLKKKIDVVHSYYEKYGIWTLILGRFIPFGFRNALFISAGIGHMNGWKFALSDFIACLTSCSIYFFIYSTYGELALDYVKDFHFLLLFFLIVGTIYLLLNWKRIKFLYLRQLKK